MDVSLLQETIKREAQYQVDRARYTKGISSRKKCFTEAIRVCQQRIDESPTGVIKEYWTLVQLELKKQRNDKTGSVV